MSTPDSSPDRFLRRNSNSASALSEDDFSPTKGGGEIDNESFASEHSEAELPPAQIDILASEPTALLAVRPNGEKFLIYRMIEPVIQNLVGSPKAMYMSVVNMTGMILFALIFSTFPLYRAGWISSSFLVTQLVFWRFAYNIGIGLMLRAQSEHRSIERFYDNFVAPFPALVESFERTVCLTNHKKLPRYEAKDYPPEYNAWIFFRAVVSYILGSDVFSFLACGFAFWEDPFCFTTVWDVLRYALGITLICIGHASKATALDVVGDFAWNWGDFFFLLKKNLVFDGIFQMFPHPMYTIGYAWMYGSVLLTKSVTLFYLSLFCQLSQMLFLVLVETPHMDKIYGKFSEPTEAERIRDEVLYDEENGYLDRREAIGVLSLKFWRASDILVAVLIVYNVVFCFWEPNPWVHVVHCVAWRLFHTVALGWALRRQSMTHCWTDHYFKSPRDAFDNWKHLYKASAVMTNLTYVIAAVHLFTSELPFFSVNREVLIMTGVCLVLIHLYIHYSVYVAIGDFGIFYGDFFVENVPVKLNYTGIYRYVNNPMSSVGFAGFYGAAMITGSVYMVPLALFSHLCASAFTNYVEKPHMQRKYGKQNIREHGGFGHELRQSAKRFKDDVKVLQEKAKLQMDRYDEFKARVKGFQEKLRRKSRSKFKSD